jgi:hypothetical protein
MPYGSGPWCWLPTPVPDSKLLSRLAQCLSKRAKDETRRAGPVLVLFLPEFAEFLTNWNSLKW